MVVSYPPRFALCSFEPSGTSAADLNASCGVSAPAPFRESVGSGRVGDRASYPALSSSGLQPCWKRRGRTNLEFMRLRSNAPVEFPVWFLLIGSVQAACSSFVVRKSNIAVSLTRSGKKRVRFVL